MKFMPHLNGTALYYMSRGYDNDDTDGIRLIRFVGDANRSLVADIDCDKSFGSIGGNFLFDVSGNIDPDPGDTLTFAWDFDGDGVVDSTDRMASFAYQTAGIYYTKLTVFDGMGGSSTDIVRVDIKNSRPIPVIVRPPEKLHLPLETFLISMATPSTLKKESSIKTSCPGRCDNTTIRITTHS